MEKNGKKGMKRIGCEILQQYSKKNKINEGQVDFASRPRWG